MNLLLLWAPVVLHMAVIFAASSTVDPVPLPAQLSDKVIHLGVYALLGALSARAFAGGIRRVTLRHAAFAIVLSTLYGISDEWHQSLVPGRTPDAMDVLADTVGATIGALAVVAFAAVMAVQGSRCKVHGSGVQGSGFGFKVHGSVQGSAAPPAGSPDDSHRDEP